MFYSTTLLSISVKVGLRRDNVDFCVRISKDLLTKMYIYFDLRQFKCFMVQRQISGRFYEQRV